MYFKRIFKCVLRLGFWVPLLAQLITYLPPIFKRVDKHFFTTVRVYVI